MIYSCNNSEDIWYYIGIVYKKLMAGFEANNNTFIRNIQCYSKLFVFRIMSQTIFYDVSGLLQIPRNNKNNHIKITVY